MLVASSAKITYGVTVHPSTATRNEKNRMNSKPAPSEIQLDLPDLKKPSGIQPANIFALQPIYVASQLEKLKIFSVVDRLVELALNGTLPVSNSGAGRLLSDYWEKSGSRMTAAERHDVYSRAFGVENGGTTSATPNREFNDLWVRFISAVSAFVQQLTRRKPSSAAQRKVKKPARDLAENLSLYGYGIGYFAARELQTQVNDMISILSQPDIRSAYGATSMWQVVEQVAVSDLGGAVNTLRYRTLATAGAVVIAWLAQHSSLLTSTTRSTVLDVSQIRGAKHSSKPTLKPNDRDLTDACEQWLAVSGTPDNV